MLFEGTLVGTVKWFDEKGEGYGFIGYAFGEVYVHYKNILSDNQENPNFKTLKRGDKVEFILSSGYYNPGTQAINVRRLLA